MTVFHVPRVRVAQVRDWWCPYGDYDGLATWKCAITLGHLDTAPHEGAWAHIVSDAPATAIGQPPLDDVCSVIPAEPLSSFEAGALADLILFPDARRLSELLSRPQPDRIVLRRGRVQQSTLPAYEQLDDLVAQPTKLTGGAVRRNKAEHGGGLYVHHPSAAAS